MPCSWQQDRNLIANFHDVLGLATMSPCGETVSWWEQSFVTSLRLPVWSSFKTSQHPGWRTMQCRKSSRATLVLKCGRHGPSQYILFIFIQHAERREDMRSSDIWATCLDVSRTKSYHCFQPSWPNCPSASSNTSVKTTSVTSFTAFRLSHFFYFFHFFHFFHHVTP